VTPTERALATGRPIWRGTWERTKTDCMTRKLVKVGCHWSEVAKKDRPNPDTQEADCAKLHRCQTAGAHCREDICRRLHGVKA